MEQIFKKDDFCQWLISNGHVENESEARNYCEELQTRKQIICVNRSENIDQNNQWYAFTKWISLFDFSRCFFTLLFCIFIHTDTGERCRSHNFFKFLYKIFDSFSFDKTEEMNGIIFFYVMTNSYQSINLSYSMQMTGTISDAIFSSVIDPEWVKIVTGIDYEENFSVSMFDIQLTSLNYSVENRQWWVK